MLWSNLQRKRVRSLLTFASVVVAFSLFGVLEAVRYALTGGVELAGQDRLVAQHKVSLIQFLPLSYLNRVRSLDPPRAWEGSIDDQMTANKGYLEDTLGVTSLG